MFQTNSHPLLRGKCIVDHLVNLRRKQRRHFPLSSLPSHWSWKQSELLTHKGGSVRSVRSTYDTTRCLFVQSNCLFYRIGSPQKVIFGKDVNADYFLPRMQGRDKVPAQTFLWSSVEAIARVHPAGPGSLEEGSN